MSNSFQDEKVLTATLELNDFLNKLFDKLLVTPEPKSERTNKINVDQIIGNSQSSRLKETKKETKQADFNDEDQELCIICLEFKVSHACIPCGHLKYCESCVKIIVDRNECAVCRSKVQSVYKIFT